MANRTTPHMQNGHVFERIYTFTFYDESIHYKFDELISKISLCPEWAYIKHYKENVETHYHAVLRFSDSKQINVVADDLGVPEHILKWRNNFRESMRYITHESNGCKKDVENGIKFIYPYTDIITNIDKDTLSRIYKNSFSEQQDAECSDVLKLLDYMESNECNSIRQLIRYACKNKQWSTLRRGGRLLCDAFAEAQADKVTLNYQSNIEERYAKQQEEKNKNSVSGIPVGFTIDNTIPF